MITDPLCKAYGGKCDCGSLWECERHDLLWEGDEDDEELYPKVDQKMSTTDPLILDAQQSIEASNPEELPGDAGFQERMSLFAQLENMRRNLEDALDRTKKRADGMKEHLLEEMAMHGIDNMSVYGLSIFSRIDRFVRKKAPVFPVDPEVLVSYGHPGFIVSP